MFGHWLGVRCYCSITQLIPADPRGRQKAWSLQLHCVIMVVPSAAFGALSLFQQRGKLGSGLRMAQPPSKVGVAVSVISPHYPTEHSVPMEGGASGLILLTSKTRLREGREPSSGCPHGSRAWLWAEFCLVPKYQGINLPGASGLGSHSQSTHSWSLKSFKLWCSLESRNAVFSTKLSFTLTTFYRRHTIEFIKNNGIWVRVTL